MWEIIFFSFFIFIIGFLFLNFLYKRTNHYNNQFDDINKILRIKKEKEESIDLVVIGSNAPKFGLDFKNINYLECRNCCIGPETFEYDFQILKVIAPQLHKGSHVILAVCPANFFYSKFLISNNTTKYYKLLNKKQFPDYNKKNFFTQYLFPLLSHPKNVKFLIRDIQKDNRFYKNSDYLPDDEVYVDAKNWIRKVWNSDFNINIENMLPLNESQKKSILFNVVQLKNIVSFCKEKEFNLHLVILPVSKELGNFFSGMFIQNYILKYVYEAILNENVEFSNFFKDERFNNKKNFFNAFFMNRKGAQKFTEFYLNEIIK